MARAIVMREPGGPEVLKVENVDVGEPGPGEVRLRQTAVGVNFHDIYVRSQASGPVDPIPMSLLFQKSNSVTRPNLFHYIEDRCRREEMAAALFNAFADGVIAPGSTHEYCFEDIGRAQRDMEERKTAGPVILRL